jgi:DNA-binding transcriptional ArsR family regulator
MELDKLFGNQTAAKALLFLARYGEGTAGEVASVFKIPKTQIYLQLVKLEGAGILTSRMIGNIRLYYFNPRSPLKNELRALLEKYIEVAMPIEDNQDFYLLRRRPRSKGKKLGGVYESRINK